MADPLPDEDRPGELVYWWEPRGDDRVFDLSSWPEDALDAARSAIDEDGVSHSWQGATIVVAKDDRERVAGVLDAMIAEVSSSLDGESDRTAYELADWPDYELDQLRAALDDAGIAYEWTDADELLVYDRDEAAVDDLFEQLALRGPNPGIELDGESLTHLLTTLFVACSTLADNPNDAGAVVEGHRAMADVQDLAIPWGMEPDTWDALRTDADALRRLLEDDAGGEAEVVATVSADEVPDGVDPDDLEVATGADDAVADAEDIDDIADAEIDGIDDAGGTEGGAGLVQLRGDDAIRAVAGRLRDRLKRLL